MDLHRRLLSQARTARSFLALTILFGFLAGILTILQAGFLSRVIAGVFLGKQGLVAAMPGLWALLVVVVLRAGVALASEVSTAAVAIRVKQGLRQLLAQKLLDLGPAYVRQERTGELTGVFVQGIEALDAYFSQYLPQLLLAVMLPASFLVVVFPLDWISGLVLLLTAPLIPIFMILIGKSAEALTRRQWTALGRMSSHFLDTLQGLATLKALNQSRAQEGRIARISENYRKATLGVLRVTFLSALVLELVGTISTAIIAVEIGLRLLYGSLGFEMAFFILLIAPEFYLPLRQLGLRFHAGTAGVSAAKRIFEVLDTAAEVKVVPAHPLCDDKKNPLADKFNLTFEGVHYTYPGREQAALSGVSFSIQSGTFTALVGPSGGGKTTITQALLRFIQPQQGQIMINGQPLSLFPLDVWREQTAWVPQHPFLFHSSLADNIRLSCPGAPLDRVRQAARDAGLDEWILSLPQGYETLAGEGGARLSSGQAQRVALARAFLKSAPVLILDEPTAHLDPQLEREMDGVIVRLCRDRTVISIAHRMPSVMRADQILVIDNGKVVEAGTHGELAARQSMYRSLVDAYRGVD